MIVARLLGYEGEVIVDHLALSSELPPPHLDRAVTRPFDFLNADEHHAIPIHKIRYEHVGASVYINGAGVERIEIYQRTSLNWY